MSKTDKHSGALHETNVSKCDMESLELAAICAFKRRVERETNTPDFGTRYYFNDPVYSRPEGAPWNGGYEQMEMPSLNNTGMFRAVYVTDQPGIRVPLFGKGRNNYFGPDEDAQCHSISEAYYLTCVLRPAHPCIVRLFDVVVDSNRNFVLEFEYFPRGTLIDEAIRHKENGQIPYFTPERARKLLLGISRGLAFLHEKRVAHCDIKGDNILCREDGSPVIADLGNARSIYDSRSTLKCDINAIGYRPPEVLMGIGFDFGVDVWALACTLIDLYHIQINARSPFKHQDQPGDTVAKHVVHICALVGAFSRQMLEEARVGEESIKWFLAQSWGLDYNGLEKFDPGVYQVIRKMLRPDPSSRITAAAIQLEPLLASFDVLSLVCPWSHPSNMK
jgi:serine/threonine protein kinase